MVKDIGLAEDLAQDALAVDRHYRIGSSLDTQVVESLTTWTQFAPIRRNSSSMRQGITWRSLVPVLQRLPR